MPMPATTTREAFTPVPEGSPGNKSSWAAKKQLFCDFDTLAGAVYYGLAFKMAAMEDPEMADLLHRLAAKMAEHHIGQ